MTNKYAALLLIAMIAHAQASAQDCKLKETLDPFTKTSIVETPLTRINGMHVVKSLTWHLEYSYVAIGDSVKLKLKFGDDRSGYLTGVEFLFADESTLAFPKEGKELVYGKDIKLEPKYASSINMATYILLTKEDLEILANKTIQLIRLKQGDSNIDKAISKGNIKAIAELSQCILSAVQCNPPANHQSTRATKLLRAASCRAVVC
jgi:hypothetical protein